MSKKFLIITISVIVVFVFLTLLMYRKIAAFSGGGLVFTLTYIAFFLGLAVIIVTLRGNAKLKTLNKKLNEIINENTEVGKILVRRDMELTEANNRLIALDQSKSEFVSIAAHQLRTPLTGIRWTFNALMEKELGELNPEQRKVVEAGIKSSMRMIELINVLLNVARIEEGRFGMTLKPQSLPDVVHSIADRLKATAEEKGITIILDASEKIPPVMLDKEKISIAIENILDNAVKYTLPGGHITITITKENSYAKLAVSDDGIGIPKEQLHRIFSKFFRADNALQFQTSGSGLGLYVVKNIVEGHDGSISIDSKNEKGTIVTILLPLKKTIKKKPVNVFK